MRQVQSGEGRPHSVDLLGAEAQGVAGEEAIVVDDGMALVVVFGSIPVIAILSWCCILPFIATYAALAALRTRATAWSITAAFIAGAVPATLAIGFPIGISVADGGRVTLMGAAFFGMLFLMAFAASTAVMEGVGRLARLVATRVRARHTLSESDKLSG